MEVQKIITKSEAAYNAIKNAIFKMEYKPGDRIVIRKIAEQIGVSDIPVREALSRLESENLVDMEPHVGYRVKQISNRDTFENLEITYELEALAIRKTAENIRDEEIMKAEKQLKEMEDLAFAEEYVAYLSKAREYKLNLYRTGNNSKLYHTLVPLFHATNPLGIIYLAVPGWCQYSMDKHEEIFNAVRNRDGEKAYNLMREYKAEGLKLVAQKFFEGTGSE